MKKGLIIFSLLVVIVSLLSFIVLRLFANGSEDNFFNQKYRLSFAKNRNLRNLLGLHYDGDARSDYLGNKYSTIRVEIDSMQGLEVPPDALELLAKKIEQITDKKVLYITSDTIPFAEVVDDEDTQSIANNYSNLSSNSSAYIYLLYVNKSANQPTSLGLTYQDFGIVLYDSMLKDFTSANPTIFSSYVESTALHEFGHQLGLIHNEEKNCLMNASVEESHVFREDAGDVITDFCKYEKDLISQERLR